MAGPDEPSRRAVPCLAGLLEAGTLAGYSRSTVANVETGQQHVPRDFWASCDKALNTGDSRVASMKSRRQRFADLGLGQFTLRGSNKLTRTIRGTLRSSTPRSRKPWRLSNGANREATCSRPLQVATGGPARWARHALQLARPSTWLRVGG